VIRPAALLVALLAARPVLAQRALDLSGGASVSSMELSRTGTSTRALSGPILGAEGRIAFKRLELRGRYLEGTLTPEAGAFGGPEDLADLRLLLGADVGAGVTIGVGPHLRAFISPAGTASWTRIEANVRVDRELVPRLARAEFELSYAVSAEANVQGGGTSATGANLGVLVAVPTWPVAIRVAYSADRATFASGGTEFLDGLEIGLRLRRP
jgi:hypothetical protein